MKKGFFLLALMAFVALTACGSSKERKMAPDSGMHHFREMEDVNLPEKEIAKADFVKMQGDFLFYTATEEEAGKQKTGLYMVSMPDGEKTRLLDTMEGMEDAGKLIQLGDGSCATAIGQGTSYTIIPITPEGMQKEHAKNGRNRRERGMVVR